MATGIMLRAGSHWSTNASMLWRSAVGAARPAMFLQRRWQSTSNPKMSREEYLKVLGLPHNATPADIKASYYNLTLRLHPDRNDGSKEATERFQAVLEAYEILTEMAKNPTADDFSSGIEGKVVPWATNTARYDKIMDLTRDSLLMHLRNSKRDPPAGTSEDALAAALDYKKLNSQILNAGVVAMAILCVIQAVAFWEVREKKIEAVQ